MSAFLEWGVTGTRRDCSERHLGDAFVGVGGTRVLRQSLTSDPGHGALGGRSVP